MTDPPQLTAWIRFGAETDRQLVRQGISVVNGNACIRVDARDVGVAANTAVDVTVVIDQGAVINAGQYT